MPVLAFTFFGGGGENHMIFSIIKFEFQLGETQVNLHQLGEFQEQDGHLHQFLRFAWEKPLLGNKLYKHIPPKTN